MSIIRIVRLVAHALMALGVAACVGAEEGEVHQAVGGEWTYVHATKATYVNSASPTSNYGSAPAIYVKNNQPKRSLIQFDLAAIPGAAQCQVLVGGELSIYGVHANVSNPGQIINAHRITESWTEFGATWNKRDASHNWSTAGVSYSTVVSGSATTNGGSFFELDVSADLLAMVAGTVSNYGWLLKDATESGSARENSFASDESSWPVQSLIAITQSTCPEPTCTTINGVGYQTTYTCSSGQCIPNQTTCGFLGCVDEHYCDAGWE